MAEHGLSPAHRLLLDAVPDRARVLDVGCATGSRRLRPSTPCCAATSSSTCAIRGRRCRRSGSRRAGRAQRAQRHWTARRALLRGRFPYAEHGLFDRTHLRFFTRAGARELAEDAGLRIVAERFACAPLPLQSRLPALARLEPAALRARPELFALQVILVGEGSRR